MVTRGAAALQRRCGRPEDWRTADPDHQWATAISTGLGSPGANLGGGGSGTLLVSRDRGASCSGIVGASSPPNSTNRFTGNGKGFGSRRAGGNMLRCGRLIGDPVNQQRLRRLASESPLRIAQLIRRCMAAAHRGRPFRDHHEHPFTGSILAVTAGIFLLAVSVVVQGPGP